MISFDGSIGANPYQDRPGITCRSVKDAATVLDAFRDKKTGTYFDAGDLYTALPRVIESKTPYVNALVRCVQAPSRSPACASASFVSCSSRTTRPRRP